MQNAPQLRFCKATKPSQESARSQPSPARSQPEASQKPRLAETKAAAGVQPHACTQRFRFQMRSFPGRTSARSLPGGIESIWETPSKERGAMFYVREASAAAPPARHRSVRCRATCSASKPPLPRHLPGIKATPACIRIIRIIRLIRSYGGGLALRVRAASLPGIETSAWHRSLQPAEHAPPKVGILPRKNVNPPMGRTGIPISLSHGPGYMKLCVMLSVSAPLASATEREGCERRCFRERAPKS